MGMFENLFEIKANENSLTFGTFLHLMNQNFIHFLNGSLFKRVFPEFYKFKEPLPRVQQHQVSPSQTRRVHQSRC